MMSKALKPIAAEPTLAESVEPPLAESVLIMRKLIPGESLSVFLYDLKKLLQHAMPDVTADVRSQLLLHQLLVGLPTAVSKQLRANGDVNDLEKTIERARLLLSLEEERPTAVATVSTALSEVELKLRKQVDELAEQVAALRGEKTYSQKLSQENFSGVSAQGRSGADIPVASIAPFDVTMVTTTKNWKHSVTELETPKNMAATLPGMTLQPLYSSSEQKKYSSTTAAISSKNAGPEGNEDLQIEQCAIPKFKKTDDVTLPEVEDKTLRQLLEKYKDLFQNSPGVTTLTHHFIPISGSPIRVPPRRIPAEYRQEVDKLIKDMLAEGILEESSSPWMAPAVYTKKKSGEIRLCVDYHEVQDRLSECGMFSTLDLQSGYWQLPVHHSDCEKTAFCPGPGLGLFQFLRMPFGLSGAPASFQCLMNKLFRDVSFVTTYLDDILIHSKTQAEHVGHLAVVLNRLKDAGLTLRGHKCKIGLTKVHYLGHVFTTEGVAPDRGKVQAVKDWPVPSDASEVCQFLGLAQLTEKGTMYSWTPECDASFNALKKQLTQAPILAYPKFGSGAGQFVLATDASNTGIGAVLEQEGRVVAYASRTLSKSEKNYSVIQKECLAIVYATKQFRHYLLGRPFTVVTDHAPLQWLSAQKMEGLLCRWALALQEYDFHIEYKKGSSNSNADALSRRPTYQPSDVVSAVRTEVDIAALRYAQEHDPHLNQVLSSVSGFVCISHSYTFLYWSVPICMMFGRQPKLPPSTNAFDAMTYSKSLCAKLDHLKDFVDTHLQQAAQHQKAAYDRHTKVRSFQVGQPVWLSVPTAGKLDPRWEGKWKVTRIMSPVTVEISDGNRVRVVHVNRMQPRLQSGTMEQAEEGHRKPWSPPQVHHFLKMILMWTINLTTKNRGILGVIAGYQRDMVFISAMLVDKLVLSRGKCNMHVIVSLYMM
eukprot:Em0088g19a